MRITQQCCTWPVRLVLVALAVCLCGCAAATEQAARAAPAEGPDLTPGERTVTVRADRTVGTVYEFWSVGNFNKPHLALDPEAVREYRQCAPFVTELNLVYLLGGRYPDVALWYQGQAEDGSVRADFSGMIDQLRAARKAGFGVRVVLDNVPYNMSDPPVQSFYGNTAPPADEAVWGRYVEAAVRAMVHAFGRDEVARWSFRVGTEPDLYPGHWAGTREQYFAHYDHTVAAVTRVLPEAIIGPGNILNPGGRRRRPRPEEPGRPPRRPRWGLDVIDHVATGTNAASGKTGTRMTVFSCSWYTGVGAPVAAFDRAMGAIRERLAEYPQFKNVTVEVGEFAVLRDDRGRRLYAGDTTEWSASFFAALADRVYTLDVRKLFEWDHATFGVLHPRGHVIEMLRRMAGGARLETSVEAKSAANCGAVACRKGQDLYVLLYNHRPGRAEKVPETVRLAVEDKRMRAGDRWRLTEWVVDERSAAWSRAFEADCAAAGIERLPGSGLHEGAVLRLFGEPGVEVWKKNAEKYARMSALPPERENVPVEVAAGRLAMTVEMAAHSVRLLHLVPAE